MSDLRVNMIVYHPRMPEWGPGNILALDKSVATIYFRDVDEEKAGDAIKRIDLDHVGLQVAQSQSEPMLDHLPPYQEGKFPLSRPRLTLARAIEAFFRRFPRGFEDPEYLDLKSGERDYKLKAHRVWTDSLGGGRGKTLLEQGAITEVVNRALAVDGLLNLLSPYEKMALRDGLKDHAAAARFFRGLFSVLDAGRQSRETFEPYIQALSSLPAQEGRARVATWPILTQFPFIAHPDRHMLLKPEISQNCAEILAFDLEYSATLNWPTYSRLMEMSTILMTHLGPRGARDFIDIQSFMWVIARLAEGTYGRAKS